MFIRTHFEWATDLRVAFWEVRRAFRCSKGSTSFGAIHGAQKKRAIFHREDRREETSAKVIEAHGLLVAARIAFTAIATIRPL